MLISALWRVPNVKYSHRLKLQLSELEHTPAAELRRKLYDTSAFIFFFFLSPLLSLCVETHPECCFGTLDASSQCGTMKQLDAAQIETVLTKSDCEGGKISSKVSKCQGQAASACWGLEETRSCALITQKLERGLDDHSCPISTIEPALDKY